MPPPPDWLPELGAPPDCGEPPEGLCDPDGGIGIPPLGELVGLGIGGGCWEGFIGVIGAQPATKTMVAASAVTVSAARRGVSGRRPVSVNRQGLIVFMSCSTSPRCAGTEHSAPT